MTRAGAVPEGIRRFVHGHLGSVAELEGLPSSRSEALRQDVDVLAAA
jgi:hypothetical protein